MKASKPPIRSDLTHAQLEKSKEMYLKGYPLREIMETTTISKSTIYYHIPKWREERELNKNEIIAALSENKKTLLSEVIKNGLDVLAHSMKELKKSNEALTAKEMVGLSNVITNIDKIIKLDQGDPTNITENKKPATVLEIKEMLRKADPFLELEEDAEVTNEVRHAADTCDN